MQVIARVLVTNALVISGLVAVTPAQAGPLTAALHGSLSGTVENSGGGMVAPSGAVYATISANDNAGSLSATLEGSAATTGALGLGLQFTATSPAYAPTRRAGRRPCPGACATGEAGAGVPAPAAPRPLPAVSAAMPWSCSGRPILPPSSPKPHCQPRIPSAERCSAR